MKNSLYPLLEIKNLQIDFTSENGTFTAVKNVELNIEKNRITGIAGESGSGKSVSCLSILRLIPAPPVSYPSGQILFSIDGITRVDLLSLEEKQLRNYRGKHIGMIFQEPMSSLNPVYTCGDQVMEAILLHSGVTKKEAKQKTIQLFENVRLPDPPGMFRRYPHQLSGGQKQRVMIAMAISGDPALLICDEPTTALDATVQKNILELLKELQANTGMGVLFITHDLGVIADIADDVAVMYKGDIVEQGKVDAVFRSPQHPYTRGLLACRPALHPRNRRLPTVDDFLKKEETDGASDIPAAEPESKKKPVEEKEILIDVKHLSVHYDSGKTLFGKNPPPVKAVDDISFNIYRGETLGLVGESGCGKTTVGRALLGLLKPKAGRILFQNEDISGLEGTSQKKFRKKVQIIFQDPYSSLNPSMTIGEAIAEPLRVHEPHLTPQEIREKVETLLEKVSLTRRHYHRYPHEFSGGQRQRIVIARSLVLQPDFIVCDESVSALDVSVQAQVLNLLNDLKKEFGFTSIFISHDLSVVKYISDRIMVMNQGRIEEIGDTEQICRSPKKTYTQTLLEAVKNVPLHALK